MRVAFTLIGGPGWEGGRNYLHNLLSALSENSNLEVKAVLFVGPGTPGAETAPLVPLLAEEPHVSRIWDEAPLFQVARFVDSLTTQRDHLAEEAFRGGGIDLVFQHSRWYGRRFRLPSLAWIADFQHRRVPSMFKMSGWLKREIGYRALSRCATRILVSSQDSQRDCERYYPESRGRVAALPFAVTIEKETWDAHPAECASRYGLGQKYLFLPNQFWRHKNHLAVIEAMRILKKREPTLVLAMSGALLDRRHPTYPEKVRTSVLRYGLTDTCRILGHIPHRDVLTLMRGAVAVVNPSLSEGWSTTVEEGATLGVPLVLSDLPVHREQGVGLCRFFDPSSPAGIAEALHNAWIDWPGGGGLINKEDVELRVTERRRRFAEGFHRIASETVARFRRGA